MSFEGKVALVTGAASGMGFATARAFCEAGAAVVMADFNPQALSQAAESLRDKGYTLLEVVCDVTDEAQVKNVVDQAVTAFGRLDAA